MDIQKEAEQLTNAIWMIDGDIDMEDPELEGRTYKEVWFEHVKFKVLQSFKEERKEGFYAGMAQEFAKTWDEEPKLSEEYFEDYWNQFTTDQ